MLTRLSIRNVVLIEALDLDFGPGLGVLTGETGAGKSILLDAVGLVLGARADTGLVRAGQERASVTASFEPAGAASDAIARLLNGAEIEAQSGEPLLLRRQVRADGGSRAFVNDQPVSAAMLREIGMRLVEIHGQHDERGLLDARGHRALLDLFGGCDLAPVRAAWRELAEARALHDAAAAELSRAEADREWLAHAVEELAALAAEPGEETNLAETRAIMQRGERVGDDLAIVLEAFRGSDGGLAQLRGAARRLDRIAGEHPALAEALALIDRALIEAGEAEAALERAGEALRFDSAALDAAETRLFDLRAMARKHRTTPDELPGLLQTCREKLVRIDNGSDRLAQLAADRDAAALHYREAAGALHAERSAAAERLDAAVAAELVPLKLDSARFRTEVTQLPEPRWGVDGTSEAQFLISTNPGADFAPLAKIASGGELSRFVLALKVALAEAGSAGTVVFDEIDRGVGGAVASAIGERLARLAGGGAQVLVVTHSPQVAAKGAAHYFIAKASDGVVTRTGVARLAAGERQNEIARMLSGAEVTAEARAQAQRLLEGV